jgi:hypothetical protein
VAEALLARDGFEEYFSEKLWELVPSIYRLEDGQDGRGALRALIELVAEQAATLRRSHDRLWDDQFVELSDEWAVPYLGDLVGTRLVSALNPRGRRVDVAKTISYRRRAGTLTVLEELASDIAGWEGTVVESFRRLARARHGLDPPPPAGAGPLSGTPAGGLADLRRPLATELVGGAFDEFHHLPDARRTGRHAIAKVGFHLFRVPARPLLGVTGRPMGPGRFTADPSGRDVPLHAPRARPDDPAEWRRAREWELPAPIRCRLLGHAEFELTERIVEDLSFPPATTAALRRLVGLRFPTEARFRRVLPQLNGLQLNLVLAAALAPDCGKAALLPTAIRVEQAGSLVPPTRTSAGSLAGWTAPASGQRLVIDPERGRLLFLANVPQRISVDYWYGFPGSIGAGSYDRRDVEDVVPDNSVSGGATIGAGTIDPDGVTQIDDSATYRTTAGATGIVHARIQAANAQRPFLELVSPWVLDASPNEDSTLVLDGLWVGGGRAVRLLGDYETVTISRSTLDPGGTDADGNAIAPAVLEVRGQVEELRLESAIAGPVRVVGQGVVERIVARDSILGSIELPRAEADLRGVTVLGPVTALRLHASETLVAGAADVADTQAGCFRFSAAPAGGRLPRPYRSHVLDAARPIFRSRRFGDPGYAQLSEAAPRGLLRGAEDGSEIGAFWSLRNPVRADSLRAKVDEFLPFGLIPFFVPET